MEALSTGMLISGPVILDPCEKEPHDALAGLSKQQREDLTVSAQQFLRMIAFRQIYKVRSHQLSPQSAKFTISLLPKVLDMDALPPQKFQQRQWRFGRKRRRSGTEAVDTEADSKLVKKEGIENMETTADGSASDAKIDVANSAVITENGIYESPFFDH